MSLCPIRIASFAAPWRCIAKLLLFCASAGAAQARCDIPDVILDKIAVSSPVACVGTLQGHCQLDKAVPVKFTITGKGRCDQLRVDFGDQSFQIFSHDFGNGPVPTPLDVTHSYAQRSVWPGPKRVTVAAVDGFIGVPEMIVNVGSFTAFGNFSTAFVIAFGVSVATPPVACNFLDGMATLPKGTKLRVEYDQLPNPKVSFRRNGYLFDAFGEPGSSAPVGFAFPGLRKYSLVLRTPDGAFQGGYRTDFTITRQPARIEFCVNDDLGYLGDNSGGWRLVVYVDESGWRR